MIQTLEEVSHDVQVLFPIHPRTRQRLVEAGMGNGRDNGLRLLKPLSYLEFLALESRATMVITDSGGIQEETTYLRVPCLTVRENTERPITVEAGTNVLVGRSVDRIRAEVARILSGDKKQGQVPPLWDGCAARRIADIVMTRC
jgi:UDP-N-acetylglucosamine 2-epimerase (non-hydrolysing)